MLLGFKTELQLNNEQRTLLAKHAGTARHAWNQGLDYTKRILDINRLAKEVGSEIHLKFPSAIDLHKWYVANVKPDCPWIYNVSKCCGQWALRQLREAWDRAFKKTSKPPKFKKKSQNDSFTLDGIIKFLGVNHIQVPVIGVLKTFEDLPQGVQPKNVTISRHAHKWFISWKLEIPETVTEKTNLAVGVDLGIAHFATLSNGEVFDVPEAYKVIKAKIAKLQYLNRNKVVGSSNWKAFKSRISALYYRLTCIRKDFLNKLATYLAKSFQVVCIEDLNVKGMMANHKLAGAIGELGWHEFRRQLEYKCRLHGSELRVISRWAPSSKTHHACGWANSALTLKDRIFNCQQCDESIDRDWNASLNIEKWGLAQIP